MAKLTDHEVAYTAARIGTGLWMVLYSWPMLLMTFGGHMSHRSLGLGSFFMMTGSPVTVIFAVYYFVVLLAGLGLLLGLQTRRAAVIGVLVSLPMASVLYGAVFIGLIVFRKYNRMCFDRVEHDSVS